VNLRVILTALAMTACSAALPNSSPTTTTPPATTTRLPATPTTAPALGTAGLAGTDRLERSHRLAQVLPVATAHYRIDFTVGADGRLAVTVTLLAVLNAPRDLAAYQADLHRYRAEALAFIAAQGDDSSTYTVTLVPDPATN
jgi:hypothetical protein